MLPTVLVSNLDVEGVKQCIGDRVYDRLRDDGGKVIAFTWGSMRGQANKQGNKDA
jgi:DNA replication protein DnaC